jgi:hypothetical protein
MFVLLQRRNKVELVLTVQGEDDPALEAFLDRFNISKACGSSSSSDFDPHSALFEVRGQAVLHNLTIANLILLPPGQEVRERHPSPT